ncbi:MAG: DUF4276 family protein [Methylococcaceae bacterium]|nr:DUF4276 family protein [Methylococcaceae bacterium]
MKFVLFVEGYTEKEALSKFLKRWLEPRLSQAVGIETVRFEGWSKLIKDAPQKARMYLQGSKNDDIIAVISLLDLYGPTIYPKHLTTADERYDWAKKDIEQKVGQERFFHFFAVHEIEAWLLSDPRLFPSEIQKAFPAKISSPETVNFDEPPAKLLERLYPLYTGRKYKKVTHGKELFGKLDPNLAYGKCPKLKLLLDTMLELAQQAMR